MPSSSFFVTDFIPLASLLNTAPIIAPKAIPTDTTVTPYFLKISLILSPKSLCCSLSATCGANLSSSSLRSATLAYAASLSEGEVFSFSITFLSYSFLRLSSASRSFKGFWAFQYFFLFLSVFLFCFFFKKLCSKFIYFCLLFFLIFGCLFKVFISICSLAMSLFK